METSEIRRQLSDACIGLADAIYAFQIQCEKTDWEPHTVRITEQFTEIFPNVLAKIAFPKKESGNKTIIIKAKAGSKLDPHKMLPARFVYVIDGDQRDEAGLIVLNEDEGMIIKPLEITSMHFSVDTKLLMEVEEIK